jgi:hypothetical protein
VARVRGRLVVGMTRDATEGRIVSRVDVASAARDPHAWNMSAGVNGEECVVEGCSRPGGRVVASCARCRETSRYMVRTSGARVLRLVARITVRGCGGEVPVDVATGAGHGGMCSCQRKHSLAVVERG